MEGEVMEATGQAFGVSEEEFQHMVTVRDEESNRSISALHRQISAELAEAGIVDEIGELCYKLGILDGVRVSRVGF